MHCSTKSHSAKTQPIDSLLRVSDALSASFIELCSLVLKECLLGFAQLRLLHSPLKDGYARICVKEVNMIRIDMQGDFATSMC